MKTTLNFLLLILYVLLIISCEDKDDKKMKLENAEIQLVSGSTAQIIVTPSILGCEFESKQPLIASVSTEGVVKGVKIGKTVVSVINNTNGFSENCYVTISPMYKMYNEPFMGFGKPKSHVMSFENRKLLSETTDGLLYEGENYSIFAVLYLFENLKLQSSVVLLEYSVTNPKELVSFLAERYILNEGEGDIAINIFQH